MRTTTVLSLGCLAILLASLSACSSSSSDSAARAAENDGNGAQYSDAGANPGKGGSGGAGGSSQGNAGSGQSAGAGGGSAGSGGGSAGNSHSDAGASADAMTPQPDSSTPADAATDAQDDAQDAAPTCDLYDSAKPTVLYLSSDDSNSMASPALVRNLIRSGQGIYASNFVRTYEFLNYYNVKYDNAPKGSLRIVPEARPGTKLGEVELQIGVQAEAPAQIRRPVTITFVLDTSGSMSGTPIDLEKSVVKSIAAALRSGDKVSMVQWSDSHSTILDGHTVTQPNDPVILTAANSLNSNGSTDLSSGLIAGYDLANKYYRADGINRVVLISDGQANTGITDETLIGKNADDNNREGIYMVGVGVGNGVNDSLMNTVTDAGNGASVYIDSSDEAQKMFYSRFDEVMEVAARGVLVEMTLPWYMHMQEFHGEQYSGDPKAVKPQHLAPGDAMVFHQILSACDPQKIVTTDQVSFKALWSDPVDYSPRSVSTSMSLNELFNQSNIGLLRGRAIVGYAEALKKLPKLSSTERAAAIDEAISAVVAAQAASPDSDLAEIKTLLETIKKQI